MLGSPFMATYRVCFCFRRSFRLSAVHPPQEIKSLFDQYAYNGVMGVDQLQRFLVEFQGEKNATKEDAQAIMESLREFKHLHAFLRKGLNLDAFFRYLFGEHNPPLSPSPGVLQDMNAPLSHYYIFTGHNSYLTGNQLSSNCSDVPIINALKRGVRVIELDMWPNSTRDNIDIFHGRTLTPSVELIKCLRSIKEHAFVASPYPVVITLEDHLTPDLQEKVAQMVTDTFGEMLFYPKTDPLEQFPSPNELMRRIIISTKPPKEYLENQIVPDKDDKAEKGKDSAEDDAWGKEVPDLKVNLDAVDKGHRDHHHNQGHRDHHHEDDGQDEGDHGFHNTAPQYKRLIAIHAGKGKGTLNESLMVDLLKVRRLSMSEQELERAVVTHGADIVRFTQRNLLRIYPKGTRFNSSNFNPLLGWMHGAQMVASNMQGYGRSLWLMHGMFRGNGGCGYVKKPDFLLKIGPHNEVFDLKASTHVKKTLKVKVFMGGGWHMDFHHTHFDTYSPPDFYVRVGIAGVPADTIMKKTKAIEDNWIPIWNEEFAFPLTVPELALLRIEVHEYDMSEKDDFGGQTCLPISELRSGIRAVPLFDRKGGKLKSVKLLMRFEVVEGRA